MRFSPKTEKEVSEANLLPPGNYAFEVLEAEDKESKSGNDMIALKLAIDTDEGRRIVFDYLVSGVFEHKIRHFFDTIGKLDAYAKGDVAADTLVGCAGEAKIVISPAKDGYDAKSAVQDYVKRSSEGDMAAPRPAKGSAPAKAKRDDMDDDIPF